MSCPIEREHKFFGPQKKLFLEKHIFPITGEGLLYEAFKRVRREKFIRVVDIKDVYAGDYVLGLDEKGASISQPSLMATMLKGLELTGKENVLEVGTGSGYQTALLACCAKNVYTIEINPNLVDSASEVIAADRHENVEIYCGDGALGLPGKGPFDAIIVAAGAKRIPEALIEQLREGGRIVIPVGDNLCELDLVVAVKHGDKLETKIIEKVGFHPLVSETPGGWSVGKAEPKAASRSYTRENFSGITDEERREWERQRKVIEEFARQIREKEASDTMDY